MKFTKIVDKDALNYTDSLTSLLWLVMDEKGREVIEKSVSVSGNTAAINAGSVCRTEDNSNNQKSLCG